MHVICKYDVNISPALGLMETKECLLCISDPISLSSLLMDKMKDHFALYFKIYSLETNSVSTTVAQKFKRRGYVIRLNSDLIFIWYAYGSCKIFRRSRPIIHLRGWKEDSECLLLSNWLII